MGVLPIPQGWTAFSLSHIVYPNPTQLAPKIFYTVVGVASLIPITMFVVYLCMFYYRREISALYIFFSGIACELINQIIKNILQEPRPSPLRADSYGRPSSHSQHAWFAATVYFIFLFYWPVRRDIKDKYGHHSSFFTKICTAFLFALVASAVGASRIILGFHTVSQVVEGGLLGSFLGLIFGYFMTRPSFHKLITQPLCSFFSSLYLRDTFPTPEVNAWEYDLLSEFAFHRNKKQV